MSIKNNKQYGAVSLFVVIFAALLITVVTVSFVRLMVKDQQQASTTDLSQSAYDSAQAGVEDAKRALLRYQSICNTETAADCATAAKAIDSSDASSTLKCNDAVTAPILNDVSQSDNEVKIQTGGNNSLDQAYTCVKINLNTVDYLGTLSPNESKVIPLTSTDPFDTVQIQWFSSDDISSDKNYDVDLQPLGSTSWPLLSQGSWATNRPPIMRTQLMQFGSAGFKLTDFDNTNASSESNANTVFLYPRGVTGAANPTVTAIGVPGPDTSTFVSRDTRQTPTGAPLPITCSGNLSGGGYACTSKMKLPTPIGGGDRTAFLQLGSIYNKTSYRVTLLDSVKPCDQFTWLGAGCIDFKAVQPQIDSTGRTNDLFRRVQTRVELTDVNFPYPDAAVDITGNLCKNFRVTDNVADYQFSCTP